MSNASGVPVLQDEINRKAFETMDWLVGSLVGGRMSARQFSTGVDALFMGVAGLVGRDIMEMMSMATYRADSSAQAEKVFLVKGDAVMRLMWMVGEREVWQEVFRNASSIASKSHIFADSAAARDGLQKLTERMVSAGYVAL